MHGFFAAVDYTRGHAKPFKSQSTTTKVRLRPGNTGNITNTALQVATVCSSYNHPRGQQISMLQNVEKASTFYNMKICFARS